MQDTALNHAEQLFAEGDVNGDGTLNCEEVIALMLKVSTPSPFCLPGPSLCWLPVPSPFWLPVPCPHLVASLTHATIQPPPPVGCCCHPSACLLPPLLFACCTQLCNCVGVNTAISLASRLCCQKATSHACHMAYDAVNGLLYAILPAQTNKAALQAQEACVQSNVRQAHMAA